MTHAVISSDMDSPYRGLTPYTERDAAYFFGRTTEIATLTANLEVARLTIFYGPSGVGKSSVLRAGVIHQLRRAQENLQTTGQPRLIPIYFNRWQTDPLTGLTQATAAAIQAATSKQTTVDDNGTTEPQLPTPSFTTQLRTWIEQTDSELLFVLDQFEEYFLYHNEERGPGSFAHELVQAINSPYLRANFLLALREDGLARLDHFKGQIPFLLDNRLSIQHLDRRAGYEAITAPLQQYNKQYATGYTLEPALIEAVLDQVGRGKVALGKQGSGLGATETANDRVEAPYLQLVLTRLWEQERLAGAATLQLATLEALGGAVFIVANYLNDTIASLSVEEQAMAAHFFDRLVTPSGAKIALTLDELAHYAEAEPLAVQSVLQQLQDKRLLRSVQSPAGVSQYEIFHDVLGRAILDWQTRYQKAQEEQERLTTEQELRAEAERRALEAAERADLEERAHRDAQAHVAAEQRYSRRQRWLLGVMAVLVVAAILSAVIAYRQARVALVRQVASEAIALSSTEPDTALLLAVEAYQRQSGNIPEAHASLLAAMQCCADAALTFLTGHTDRVWDVAFSSQQNILASGGDDGTIMIWDLATQRALTTITNPQTFASIYSIAFSPDGKLLAAGDGEGSIILRDTATWTTLEPVMRGHTYNVHSLAFSLDGTRLVSGGADGRVIVWNVATHELEKMTPTPHTDWVWDVAISPDNRTVASGGRDKKLILWDIESENPLTATLVLTDGLPILTSVAFNRDKEHLLLATAGAGTGYPIMVWEMQPWQQTHTRPTNKSFRSTHTGTVWGLSFSPVDDQVLVSSSESGTVRVWQLKNSQDITNATLTARSLGIAAGEIGLFRLAVSPDGKTIATGGFDGLVKLWQTDESNYVIRHQASIRALTLLNDGRTLAASSEDGAISFWDIDKAQQQSTPHQVVHEQSLKISAISPDGGLLAAPGISNTIVLWDTATGQQVITLTSSITSPLLSLLFSPGGNRLASGYKNGDLLLWDVQAEKLLAPLSGHPGLVTSLTFNRNGTILVSGGCSTLIGNRNDIICGRGEIRVWDTVGFRQIGQTIKGKSGAVNVLRLHPQQSDLLAVGSNDGIAMLVNIHKPAERLTMGSRGGSIQALAFSPDGQYLAVGRNTYEFSLYDTKTGQIFGKTFREHDAGITTLAFSPDEKWLFSGSRDNTVVVHNLNPSTWVAHACRLANRNLTRVEWTRYLGSATYRRTCANLPAGE